MLADHLFRCMAHNAIAALVIAVAYMGALATAEQTQPVDSGPTLAEQLAAGHDCWTDEAPADMKGKRPGHAVVSDATGHATYSAANVRIALEHVFEGKHPAITVHAFCR